MLPRPITFRRLVHRLSRSRKQLQPPWPYRLRQSASPSNPTFGRSKQRLLPGLSRIRLLCPTACLNRRQRATHSAKKEAARSRNCPLASHTPCCEASPPRLAHKGTCVHLQALLPSARQCLTPRLLTRRVFLQAGLTAMGQASSRLIYRRCRHRSKRRAGTKDAPRARQRSYRRATRRRSATGRQAQASARLGLLRPSRSLRRRPGGRSTPFLRHNDLALETS